MTLMSDNESIAFEEEAYESHASRPPTPAHRPLTNTAHSAAVPGPGTPAAAARAAPALPRPPLHTGPKHHSLIVPTPTHARRHKRGGGSGAGSAYESSDDESIQFFAEPSPSDAEKMGGSATTAAEVHAATTTTLLPSPRPLPRRSSLGSVPSINFQLENAGAEGTPGGGGAESQSRPVHGPSPPQSRPVTSTAAAQPQSSSGARPRQSPLPPRSLTVHSEAGPVAALPTPGSVTNNSIAFQIDELASSATEDNNIGGASTHPASGATRRSRSAGNVAALRHPSPECVAEPRGVSPAAPHHTPLQPGTPDQALLSTRSIDFQLDEASQMTDRPAIGPDATTTSPPPLHTPRHQLDHTTSDEDEGHGQRHDTASSPQKKTVVTNRLSRTPSLTTGVAASGPRVARRGSLHADKAPPNRTRRQSSSSSSSSSSRHVPLPGVAATKTGARVKHGTRDARSHSASTTDSGVSLRGDRAGVAATTTMRPHSAFSAAEQQRHPSVTPTRSTSAATAAALGGAVRNGGRSRGSSSAPHATPTKTQQTAETGLSPLSARSDTASRYRGTEGTATRDASHDMPHVDRTALPTRAASQPGPGRHGAERRRLAGTHGHVVGRVLPRHQPRHPHNVITRSILRHLAEQERRVRLHQDTTAPLPMGGSHSAPGTTASSSSRALPPSSAPIVALAALTRVYKELMPADDDIAHKDMAEDKERHPHYNDDSNEAVADAAVDAGPRPLASPVPYPQGSTTVTTSRAVPRNGVVADEAHRARDTESVARRNVAWSLVPTHGLSRSGWPVAVTPNSTEATHAQGTAEAVRQAHEEATRWHEYNAEQRNELMQLQQRIAQAEREDRTLLLSQSTLHDTHNDDDVDKAARLHVRQTAAQKDVAGYRNTRRAVTQAAAAHNTITTTTITTTSLQEHARHSAPVRLSGQSGAATKARALHSQHDRSGRQDGRYAALRSPRAVGPQKTFLQPVLASATADNGGSVADDFVTDVTSADTAASEVAAMLGVLWPPLRAHELFFLTGARLTAGQVRRFYEAVRMHEPARQPSAFMDAWAVRPETLPSCTERRLSPDMLHDHHHGSSSPRLLQQMPSTTTTTVAHTDNIAAAVSQPGIDTAPKRRRALCRTKVLREVFDLLDVSRRGVLYAADLPTLKLLAERELAVMDKIARRDTAARVDDVTKKSQERSSAVRTAGGAATSRRAGAHMGGKSAVTAPPTAHATTRTTSATVTGDASGAFQHGDEVPRGAAPLVTQWDDATQKLHQGLRTADAVFASADTSSLLLLLRRRTSGGAEDDDGGGDAARLQRRALLLSFAVNVVLPLAMMSAISPLSFATVSLLVLSAVDHAAGRGGQHNAATRVRAAWREVVQQYFLTLS